MTFSQTYIFKLRAKFTKKDELELPLLVFINYHNLKTKVGPMHITKKKIKKKILASEK